MRYRAEIYGLGTEISWDVVLYAGGALMWSWSICARD